MRCPEKANPQRWKVGWWWPGAGELGVMRSDCQRAQGFFWGDKVLESTVGCITLEYTKNH